MIFKKIPSARFQNNSSFRIAIHHNFPISKFQFPISRNWMMSFYQQYLQFYKRFTYIKVKRFFPSPLRNFLIEKFLCSVAQLGRKCAKLINRYYKILWLKSTSFSEDQTRIPLKLNIEKISCRQKGITAEQFLHISVHTDIKSTKKAFF